MSVSPHKYRGPQGLLSTHLALSGALLPFEFSLYAPQAKQVFLIGEMTHWLQDKLPMVLGEDGFWRIQVNLRRGQWMYKFEVDGQWLADPANPLRVEDGMGVGELQSYCFVGEGDWGENPAAAHGQVLELELFSPRLGRPLPYTLYLPPGSANQTYPLLTLLHGHQMQANQWPGNGRIAQFMDNLLDQGVIQPFAVLMPAGHGYHHHDTMRYGYALVEDLLPWLSKHYAISPQTQQRGVAGMSIQRFGPLALALDHPQTFGWVAPINENFAEHVLQQAPQLPQQPFAVRLFCTVEGCAYPRYEKLLQAVGQPLHYMRVPGEPTWRNWNQMTRELLVSAHDFFTHNAIANT